MAAHAAANHRDLGDIGGGIHPGITYLGLGGRDGILGARVIGRRYREGQIGGFAVFGDVLHDHVDVDIGVRERPEDRGGDARLVLDLAHGNLRLVLGKGDPGDDVVFHDFLLAADQRARRLVGVRIDILWLVETGAAENRPVVHHADFHPTYFH